MHKYIFKLLRFTMCMHNISFKK